MFIRENKTSNKKTGEIYIKHILVESVRVQGQPRQRVVMGLGRLDLPRREWKKLAHALECQLSGQLSLLEDNDKYIEDLALSLISNNKLSKKLDILESSAAQTDSFNCIPIDFGSISTEKTRSFGAELVCQDTWDLLKFDQILKDCGFSRTQRSVAKVLIFGRLISPGSERHTIEWFQKHPALSELPGFDTLITGKNIFYEIGGKLYENKDKIEELLYHNQQLLFPSDGHTVFLYDLTNTYMEGSCLGNGLAARGHCKSKRTDCPLITLSLIVRNDGIPVASHIYKGNQGEPETMRDMLSRLQTMSGYDSPQMVLEKPTIIMDRGIATQANIALLTAEGYQYTVVTREDQSKEYLAEFETARDTFTRIDDLSHKHTAYGDENHVYVKKIEPEGENTCKVLCLSDGKAHKENAIASRKDARYIADVENLSQSIQKGNIKNIDKIEAKLKNTNKKHKIAAEKYDALIIRDDAGKAQRIDITAKSTEPNPLAGCYVIESTHTELDAAEIWKLYMTQVHVEASFRAMKSELGMRPVFHQKEDRSSAHLFITVLAYHILSAIERRLAFHNDTRQWQTLRGVLSTHTRITIVMKDNDGFIYHHRVTGKPEDVHQDIYKILGIKDPTKTVTSRFK
jgi:transposase